MAILATVDWDHIERLKFGTLCNVCGRIVGRLPAGSLVLCVIDETSRYEVAGFTQDNDAVIRRLTRLESKRSDITFKLLVTCQGRAFGISSYFSGHAIDLPESVEAHDDSGWQVSTVYNEFEGLKKTRVRYSDLGSKGKGVEASSS
jgi:hypothetical protein